MVIVALSPRRAQRQRMESPRIAEGRYGDYFCPLPLSPPWALECASSPSCTCRNCSGVSTSDAGFDWDTAGRGWLPVPLGNTQTLRMRC
jgi:hypothetical protein